MRAGGISPYRSLFPLLLTALFISFFTMFVNEASVPSATRKTNEIQRMRQEKNPNLSVYKNTQFYGASGNMIYNQSFEKKRKILKEIQILRYSPRGFIESRIDAEKAKWSDNHWVVQKGFRKRYDKRGNPLGKSEPIRELHINETPQDFSAGEKEDSELSFRELKKYIDTLEKSGFQPRRELVELYSRVSLPLSNLIIMLIGIPFALYTRRGGIIIGFGKAIGIGFIYLALFRVGQLLGRGALPPAIGAWLANALFGAVGVVMIFKVRK